jgi:hypothetical protein
LCGSQVTGDRRKGEFAIPLLSFARFDSLSTHRRRNVKKEKPESNIKFTNDDHIRFMNTNWKDLGDGEKYERIKKNMLTFTPEAWMGFKNACGKTFKQQQLLSTALATEESLPELKQKTENELNSYADKIIKFFDTGENKLPSKMEEGYKRTVYENTLIREAEKADSDPLVKSIKINRLVKIAEYEKEYRPDEFVKISKRAEEMLEGSKEFSNYRIFKKAFEEAEKEKGVIIKEKGKSADREYSR